MGARRLRRPPVHAVAGRGDHPRGPRRRDVHVAGGRGDGAERWSAPACSSGAPVALVGEELVVDCDDRVVVVDVGDGAVTPGADARSVLRADRGRWPDDVHGGAVAGRGDDRWTARRRTGPPRLPDGFALASNPTATSVRRRGRRPPRDGRRHRRRRLAAGAGGRDRPALHPGRGPGRRRRGRRHRLDAVHAGGRHQGDRAHPARPAGRVRRRDRRAGRPAGRRMAGGVRDRAAGAGRAARRRRRRRRRGLGDRRPNVDTERLAGLRRPVPHRPERSDAPRTALRRPRPGCRRRHVRQPGGRGCTRSRDDAHEVLPAGLRARSRLRHRVGSGPRRHLVAGCRPGEPARRPATVPTPPAPPAVTSTTAPVAAPTGAPSPAVRTLCVRSNIDFAALRSAPSLDADLLAQIPPGSCDVELLEPGTVQGSGMAWYHVRWQGTDGWTAASNTVR